MPMRMEVLSFLIFRGRCIPQYKQQPNEERANMTNNQIWDYIIENGIATEEELKLVTCINGFNGEALNGVIYARTGYHSADQLIECEA